ncbi:MAG: TlpA disulfide reductase family protein, partial [Ginsengibacter sp.]
MIFLWPFVSAGQKIKPLTIGDTVPDITISNVYNYPSSTIRFSDLKGKLVILDFWATWCGSCIETFPEMAKLKKEFGDKIQIVMVNGYYPDTIQKVKAFFKKREERTGLSFQLTFALQDSILRDMFPYKQIPHDVWINKKGIVSAITSYDEVNGDNLALFLKNNQITLPVKNDNLLFNNDKPLLIDENAGNNPTFLYRSLITGYKSNLGAVIGQRKNEEGKIKRLFVINYPLLTLFQKAYPHVFKTSINRMIIEA